MINRYPKEPPTLAELLADPLLKSLTQRDLARFLGITERTLRRWKKTGAPRQSRLLLWAISLHGLDTLQREADNTAALFAGMARSLAEEVDSHRRRISHLISIGRFDCANSPILMDRRESATVAQVAERQDSTGRNGHPASSTSQPVASIPASPMRRSVI